MNSCICCLFFCHYSTAASSSSYSNAIRSPCTTSDLSTMCSHNSTLLYHPDGEQSPSGSELAGALSVQSLEKSSVSAVGAVSVHMASSTTSSNLPRPGDPGAPPLPDELTEQAPSNIDAGSTGCTSSGGDSNFQPLRSRSLTPTLERNRI